MSSPNALKDFVQQQKSKSSLSISSLLSNGFQDKLNGGPKSFFPLLIKTSSNSADQSKGESSTNGKDDWLPSSFKEDKCFLSLVKYV